MISIKSLLPPPKKFVHDPIAPLGIRLAIERDLDISARGSDLLSRMDFSSEIQWMNENLASHSLIGKTTLTVSTQGGATHPSSPNISAIPVSNPTPARVVSPVEQFEVEDVDDVPEYPPEPFIDEADMDFEESPTRRF